MINLGDRAKDKISGLVGIVVARTEWLNKCVRITIQPEELKDGKPIDNQTFDEEQIVVVKAGVHSTANHAKPVDRQSLQLAAGTLGSMVSPADRTRTELLANRRRFRREGVALMIGEPTSFVWPPIESTRPIAVRPARRGECKPYLIDEFLTGFFDRRIFPWTLAGALLFIAILVFKHFHS